MPSIGAPRFDKVASFDFRSHIRSTLASMMPGDSFDVLKAKLRSASALLFLERAAQGITGSRSRDIKPYLEAVLNHRGRVVVPAVKRELDALREMPPEPGNEKWISHRSKALFSLLRAADAIGCT